MSEELITLLRDSFTAENSVQGVIIAIVVTLLMRRYASVVYMAILAIVIDQFVTIAFNSTWGDTSVEGVAGDLWNSIINLDATVVISRFIVFMVLISVFYALRSFFKRT